MYIMMMMMMMMMMMIIIIIIIIIVIDVETFGSLITSACQLFVNPGLKISLTPGDEREGAFLFCREFRCWCNTTTLSCYVTPFQPLTARSDDMYAILSI